MFLRVRALCINGRFKLNVLFSLFHTFNHFTLDRVL